MGCIVFSLQSHGLGKAPRLLKYVRPTSQECAWPFQQGIWSTVRVHNLLAWYEVYWYRLCETWPTGMACGCWHGMYLVCGFDCDTQFPSLCEAMGRKVLHGIHAPIHLCGTQSNWCISMCCSMHGNRSCWSYIKGAMTVFAYALLSLLLHCYSHNIAGS